MSEIVLVGFCPKKRGDMRSASRLSTYIPNSGSWMGVNNFIASAKVDWCLNCASRPSLNLNLPKTSSMRGYSIILAPCGIGNGERPISSDICLLFFDDSICAFSNGNIAARQVFYMVNHLGWFSVFVYANNAGKICIK